MSEGIAPLPVNLALKAAAFDLALAALICTDEDGRIVEFNPAAETLLGHRREDVIGRPVGEVVIPERYRLAHEAGLARQRAGHEGRILGRRLQLEALRADGSELPVEMALWRTTVEGRCFFTASFFDITERRRAAQQLEALQHSERLAALGGLLAGVAHELNNPLAVAMGRASLLEECSTDPRVRDAARRVREATERCGRIVRTFARMAQRKPAERGEVQLNEVANSAADMLQYGFRAHSVALTQRLALDLPIVHADPQQVLQIVLSLLTNARHAVSGLAHDRQVEVTSGAALEPRAQAWLEVSDNRDLGDAEAFVAHAFEPSAQAVDMNQRDAGLPLPILRSLARANGAELSVRSLQAGPQRIAFRLEFPAMPVRSPAS